ncbi:unnamed protein product [Durusdinium trenchii]|uniref:Uncharacterized protein n=1 Tax=Durusdinium trenchii TaxID=1381693 RepID=A0ABP0T1Z8_9DINO
MAPGVRSRLLPVSILLCLAALCAHPAFLSVKQVRVAPAAVAAATLVSQAVRADDEVPQAAPAVEVAPAEVPQAAPAVEVAPAEVPQAVPVESAPESAGTIIPAFWDPNFNFDDWLLTPEADYFTVPFVIIGSILVLYTILWVGDRLAEGQGQPPTP